MTDATINRGTPRERRDVTTDKQWLENRIFTLDEKIEVLKDRVKRAQKEKKEREKQLEAL